MNRSPKLRWRVVLGIPVLLFGGLILLGSIWVLGFMVYMNLRHGWITVHPETPALNRLVLTPNNLIPAFCRIVFGAILVWWGVRLLRPRSPEPDGPMSTPTSAD